MSNSFLLNHTIAGKAVAECFPVRSLNEGIVPLHCSVYEKLQATRAKVAPVNLIYWSHFSATEATYKVSQNIGNFVEFTRITHKPVPV